MNSSLSCICNNFDEPDSSGQAPDPYRPNAYWADILWSGKTKTTLAYDHVMSLLFETYQIQPRGIGIRIYRHGICARRPHGVGSSGTLPRISPGWETHSLGSFN
jgi:hypothetical protein